MTDKIFECSIWFNSSKEVMKNKLQNSSYNSGVGISIGVANKKYFNPAAEYVSLYFDDETMGQAKVKKRSWDICTHMIDICIGKWARQNGLWKQKLKKSKVPVFLRIRKKFREFDVLKDIPKNVSS